ncbi:uncharacterized protein G2W53_031360 [Senna tora]|uniref:Uncharacterized protein n=1 Tax=Senna tora TaxID=362788 RepID=A0A834T934_9FABA|nr:uncharacterized protein G2W53_031360 [Senna tora]
MKGSDSGPTEPNQETGSPMKRAKEAPVTKRREVYSTISPDAHEKGKEVERDWPNMGVERGDDSLGLADLRNIVVAIAMLTAFQFPLCNLHSLPLFILYPGGVAHKRKEEKKNGWFEIANQFRCKSLGIIKTPIHRSDVMKEKKKVDAVTCTSDPHFNKGNGISDKLEEILPTNTIHVKSYHIIIYFASPEYYAVMDESLKMFKLCNSKSLQTKDKTETDVLKNMKKGALQCLSSQHDETASILLLSSSIRCALLGIRAPGAPIRSMMYSLHQINR